MNIETIIIIITLFFAANTYYDGSLLKDFSKYKKYYKIAGCLFVGLSFYAMIKKNPDQSRNLIQSTSEFIKILPVDRNTKDMISPLLDISTPINMYNNNSSPQFKRMVNLIRLTEKMLGNGKKIPTKKELKNRPFVRKSLVANTIIKKGEKFSEKNLTTKRPGLGIPTSRYNFYLKKRAKKNYLKDDFI